MNTIKLFAGIMPIAMGIAIIVSGCGDYGNTQYYSSDKIGLLNEYLEVAYLYDLEEVTEKDMSDSIYQNFVGILDNAGTYYLNEEDLAQLKVVNEGNYLGTGLELAWESSGKSIIVTGIIEGSNASNKGIKVGDHITSIDGIKVTGANQKAIMEKIVYVGDETIKYDIEDSQTKKISTTELAVSEVKMPDISTDIKENIGYIKIDSIRDGTSDNILSAIEEFDTKSVNGIILDLRGTHTNNIEEVAKISDLFLEEGIAFKTKDVKDVVQDFEMTPGAYDKDMVIITNGYTASGAEALVTALKDNCVHVGADTSGLTYISEIIELGDGTALNVATKIIYDKNDKEINEKGIKPDEAVFISEAEKIEIIETGTIAEDNDSFIKVAIDKLK